MVRSLALCATGLRFDGDRPRSLEQLSKKIHPIIALNRRTCMNTIVLSRLCAFSRTSNPLMSALHFHMQLAVDG